MECDLVKPSEEPETDLASWEDDEFYVELKRWILQLTVDEEEVEEDYIDPRYGAFEGVARGGHHSTAALYLLTRMTSQVNLPRSVGGTGVFIPTVVESRRRVRAGRNNHRRRMYKKVQTECLSPSFMQAGICKCCYNTFTFCRLVMKIVYEMD